MELFTSSRWHDFFRANGKSSDPSGPSTCMLALEPRIMYDAAGVATALDDANNDAATAESALTGPVPIDTFQDEVAHIQDLFKDYTPPSLNQPKEIVFVDTAVEDHETLIQGVSPDARIILLDANTDALSQITKEISGHTDLDAIHIVSHGGPGSLEFGSGALD
ncbi:MAG: DUF4347 domain-containing protein, partial [Desulfobulbaceae bacterium]|nr:DUF4347 domain-containing protein [Desulfobulbaceae bacterium]